MTDLNKILYDIATNKIAPEDLEKTFDKVAVYLLRQTKLVAGKSEYLIKEIEFYFSGEHYNHKDSYVHSNQYRKVKRQGKFGEWYFHRYTNIESYRKQKFRGVDLTFGNEEFGNSGGILIRQVQNIGSSQIISGISNIVGEIMKNVGDENFHEIATQTGQLAFDKKCILHLENYDASHSNPIYKSTRVIPKAKEEKQEEYYSKLYRYFNDSKIKLVQL